MIKFVLFATLSHRCQFAKEPRLIGLLKNNTGICAIEVFILFLVPFQ